MKKSHEKSESSSKEKSEESYSNITVSPYRCDVMQKNMSVKMPSGYGDKSHAGMIEMIGKGLRSGRSKR